MRQENRIFELREAFNRRSEYNQIYVDLSFKLNPVDLPDDAVLIRLSGRELGDKFAKTIFDDYCEKNGLTFDERYALQELLFYIGIPSVKGEPVWIQGEKLRLTVGDLKQILDTDEILKIDGITKNMASCLKSVFLGRSVPSNPLLP